MIPGVLGKLGERVPQWVPHCVRQQRREDDPLQKTLTGVYVWGEKELKKVQPGMLAKREGPLCIGGGGTEKGPAGDAGPKGEPTIWALHCGPPVSKPGPPAAIPRPPASTSRPLASTPRPSAWFPRPPASLVCPSWLRAEVVASAGGLPHPTCLNSGPAVLNIGLGGK